MRSTPLPLLAERRPRPARHDLLHRRHPLRRVRHLPAPEGVRGRIALRRQLLPLRGRGTVPAREDGRKPYELSHGWINPPSDQPQQAGMLEGGPQKHRDLHCSTHNPPNCCILSWPRTASTSCTRWRAASRTTCAPRAWTTGTARCLCLTAAWPSAPVSGGGWCLGGAQLSVHSLACTAVVEVPPAGHSCSLDCQPCLQPATSQARVLCSIFGAAASYCWIVAPHLPLSCRQGRGGAAGGRRPLLRVRRRGGAAPHELRQHRRERLAPSACLLALNARSLLRSGQL